MKYMDTINQGDNIRKPIIVLPKGRLYDSVRKMFEKIGVYLPEESRNYFITDLFDDCDLFFAKPKSIPGLLASGMCDYGFVGLDIVKNSLYDNVTCLYDTQMNKVTMVLARQKNTKVKCYAPLIIASEYENIASEYFTNKGNPHYILNTAGSTEGFIKIGADYIIDIVESGETLEANDLYVVEELFKSSTCLFASSNTNKLPNILSLLINK